MPEAAPDSPRHSAPIDPGIFAPPSTGVNQKRPHPASAHAKNPADFGEVATRLDAICKQLDRSTLEDGLHRMQAVGDPEMLRIGAIEDVAQ